MSATRQRNLRSGHSIWQRRALLRFPEKRPAKNLRCDVLIIGAGISGALAAEQLTDAGLTVVILDRRGAVRGSTLASTALLQYEIDTPLSKLAKRIGRARAERIWRRSNGITFSMMAAQILRGHICGQGDADADLFSFTRRF